MRTALLANNRLGARIAEYLASRGELAGLVVHPTDRRRFGERFERLACAKFVWPDGFRELSSDPPDALLSVLFGYKVPPEWLALPRWNALNLHPGLLPWNRGAAPNVWPIVDGSPAGTTLHVMTARLDEGEVFSQREVRVFPTDTATTLYERLENASLEMFTEVWPDIRSVVPRPQLGEGSSHRMADLATLDLAPGDFAVLDKLRARTFPPYGAEFVRDGRRYQARVEILPADPPDTVEPGP